MVRSYMTRIIRDYMASQRGINPVDVDMNEVIEAYENDSLEDYKIKEVEIISYENGKEVKSVLCSLVDRSTGDEYNCNVIVIQGGPLVEGSIPSLEINCKYLLTYRIQ